MRVPLGDVADFIRDGTHGSPARTEVGIPVLSAMNVKDGLLNFDTDRYTSDEEFEAFSRRVPLATGDVLLTIVGTIGRAAVVEQVRPLVFQRSVAIIRPKEATLDSRFLYHVTQSTDFQTQLDRASNKSSQAGVYLGKLGDVLVPLPPTAEQRRIAAVLDKADALRTKRREALAQLDHLAQSNFVEMFGFYKKDQIRWTTKPLAELASDMKIGLVRSSDEFGAEFGIPYVRMNAVGRSGEFFRELVQKTDVADEELKEYCLQPGDILFNTRNSKELVGKTAIFREAGKYVYNNNLMRLRFHEQVNVEYMAQCFLTPFIRQELEFRKSGTTSVFAIYARDLNTVPIPVPPIELQREFAKRMQSIYRTSLKMVAHEQETTGLFASLQHRAFQGEL